MRTPKGVLLDYGGTLIEETSYDARAGHSMLLSLASYVPAGLTLDTVMHRAGRIEAEVAARRDQTHVETPWPTLMRLTYDFLGVRFDARVRDLEMEFWKASVTTRPMLGAREALEEFHRAGIPLAIVSNCSFDQQVLWYELGKHSLAGHLAFIMVSADYSVRKPNPLLFEVAAAKLGVERADVWFIGDREDTDMAGATAAGMQPVLLRDWATVVTRFHLTA